VPQVLLATKIAPLWPPNEKSTIESTEEHSLNKGLSMSATQKVRHGLASTGVGLATPSAPIKAKPTSHTLGVFMQQRFARRDRSHLSPRRHEARTRGLNTGKGWTEED
jgi:hypothetical protein